MSRAAVIVWAVVLALLVVMFAPAHGAPPSGSDPALAPFFGSLTLDGVSCCSISDCRAVPARVGQKGWEAFVSAESFPGATDDRWVEIPVDKIVRGKHHPLGEAVMCWSPYRGPLCFVEPPGA